MSKITLLKSVMLDKNEILKLEIIHLISGGHPNYYANTETPPRREVPPGTDVSKILAPPVQHNTGTEVTEFLLHSDFKYCSILLFNDWIEKSKPHVQLCHIQ